MVDYTNIHEIHDTNIASYTMCECIILLLHCSVSSHQDSLDMILQCIELYNLNITTLLLRHEYMIIDDLGSYQLDMFHITTIASITQCTWFTCFNIIYSNHLLNMWVSTLFVPVSFYVAHSILDYTQKTHPISRDI